MKRVIQIGLVCLLLLHVLPTEGQIKLSEEAKISVLTCAPYNEAVFTLYGHAAFRVNDPVNKIDVIFNYGIFDFSKPNFLFRFSLGETDYRLDTANYMDYIVHYQMEESDITEQVLNLSPEETARVWTALLINVHPQNAVYRYNFFFDNCATRIPAIVEKCIDGKVTYNNRPKPQTFRDLITHCTHNNPWYTFGCDLALGSPTDRIATPHEMMFLPDYLRDEFSHATIVGADGSQRPLVERTSVIDAADPDDNTGIDWLLIFTPVVCGWLLFVLIAGFTYREWRKQTHYPVIDMILFSVAGVAGVVLFFLSFISTHPCIWPNWSVVWLHPFHLIAVVLFCLKSGKKAVFYYHFLNFAALLLMLLGWYFIPQQLNAAFIPLVATLCIRSWHGVCYFRKKIG